MKQADDKGAAMPRNRDETPPKDVAMDSKPTDGADDVCIRTFFIDRLWEKDQVR